MGIALFKRIFTYFKPVDRNLQLMNSGRDHQFEVLKKVIVSQIKENCRDIQYNSKKRVKLNMKVILLLQFIEEIFLQREDELIKTKSFQETMTLFMILLDKLSILTFDMPDDAVSLYHQMIRGKGSRPPSSLADTESQKLIEISPQ